MLFFNHMKRSNKRPTSRLNPLDLRKTGGKLPKSGIASTQTEKLPFWKRLIPFQKGFKFSWKKFLLGILILIVLLFIAIAAVFAYYVRDLPNPTKLIDQVVNQSTKILDRNGTLIYSFHGDQNRTLVTLDNISPNLKNATLAVEDANFYNESGFAVKGIARAVYCRINSHCGLESGGGSTITQQFVKNAIQSVDTASGKPAIAFTNRTLSDKVKELILSIEVEQRYSKDDILTGYLNNISYGNSTYGIEAASETYFGVHAKDLTLSQAATLAAIPQLPTYYSPYGTHLDKLMARKALVLDRMVKVGYISQADADKAKTDAPTLDNPSFAKQGGLVAPHFTFFVRQALIDFIGGDPATAEQRLDSSGMIVHTSLDMNTQNLAQGILENMGPNAVKKYNATNAALSAVDPNTGEILAMVGSIDYTSSKSGNTNFATAALQPGSSFKPFVYATEFDPDHKKSPASITYDVPTDFGGGYAPNNYDGKFRGPITDRLALAGSLNIPAVKNFYMAGSKQSIDTAHRMGITTLNADPSTYGLSLVLGSGEVRGVDMANSYGTFANGGTAHALRPILYIEQSGKTIKDYRTDAGKKAIEPEVAYEISNILSDVNAKRPVFGSLVNNLTLSDRTVAAKTGTTQSFRDSWTVGYTPQIAVAVWVGNNDPGKTMNSGSDGSVVAAPIWKQFMTQYLAGKPVLDFTKPDDITTFTVDKLSGKIPTDQTPTTDGSRITDIFAPWQIPKDFDDVHQLVKIDKVSGKLATSLTPAEDIVDQFYFNVHSEEPDKPNWENPVQAWALANGGGSTPPTATDDVHTDTNKPTISITAPANNSTITGPFTITTSVGGPQAITKVEFFINNVSVGTATQAPWQLDYDASSLPSGSEIIETTVTNSLGLTSSTQITVTKGDAAPPTPPEIPGPVTSATATNGMIHPVLKAVHLSWLNPASTALSSVVIYQSSTSTALGTQVKSLAATSGAAASTDITITTPGTYYFTIRTANSAGDQNTPGVTVMAQVLP